MSGIEWAVLFTAAAAIGWINWYFFLSQKTAAQASVNASGAQDVKVVVRGGYEPSTIQARAGVPLRLVFDRQETSGCSEEVVFPDFGVKRFLPAHEETTIEITPQKAGQYEFTCGMGMLRGRLIVEDVS
jgi:plastocyanin domain-containing protein